MTQSESEKGLNNGVESNVTEAEDVEALRQALAEERTKAEDYLANWQRTQADFINYKRRNEQERAELNKFANSVLILGFLPILDDLERALESIPPRLAQLTWIDGIRLIERKFRANLEAQGLSLIKALGEPFDPKFHEAVRQDKGKQGMVIEEVQKGYMLHDRVIRPTMVVVGDGDTEEKEDK